MTKRSEEPKSETEELFDEPLAIGDDVQSPLLDDLEEDIEQDIDDDYDENTDIEAMPQIIPSEFIDSTEHILSTVLASLPPFTEMESWDLTMLSADLITQHEQAVGNLQMFTDQLRMSSLDPDTDFVEFSSVLAQCAVNFVISSVFRAAVKLYIQSQR